MGFIPVVKPARSEDVISPEQQLALSQKVEAYFEDKAPKRAQKPPRSEGSGDFSDYEAPKDMPELAKLKDLQSHSDVIVPDHFVVKEQDAEAYEENKYYEDLSSVDKESHHTIGTGFIALDAKPDVITIEDHSVLYRDHPRSNPATNDWEPSVTEVTNTSIKPSRSEAVV